jgi:hypothetical protein
MSQPDTGNAMETLGDRYCSTSDAVKLISQSFEGDKRNLREFVDNVTTAKIEGICGQCNHSEN